MYITINDIIGEKRIDLSYPIKGKDGPCGPGVAQRPHIAVFSMLSNNAQIWLQGPIEMLLKTGKKIVLNKGVYMYKELDTLIGTEMKYQISNIKISNAGFL